MKPILIISFWNPTIENPNKGIFIHDQVDAICQTRFDIIFLEINILASTKIFSKTIIEKNLGLNKKIVINVYSVFWKIIYVNPWLIFLLTKRYLQKKYKDFKPALIHSNIIFPCAIIGHLLAKKYNSKHIISEHWSKAEKFLKHPVYGKIALKTYRDSKAILCVSDFLANKIRLATRHPNTIIIPNIIDTDLFHYSSKQIDNNKVRFTCVATWKKPKRLDLIINSLITYASETNKCLILNVVGDGKQKEEFLKIRYPSNLVINWLGYIGKTEIVKILNQSDIFMHASEIETFSIVTVEALSTGTPVLASNTGALPELINLNNGILVENTLDSWVKGLREITLRNFNHEAFACEIVGKYSSDSVAKRIEKVYNNFLSD